MSSPERRPALFTRHPPRVAICKAPAHHSEDADTGGILSSLVLPVLPSACVRVCVSAACYVSEFPAQVCVSTVTHLCFNATLSQESGPRVPAPTPAVSLAAGRLPATSHVRCGPLLCCPWRPHPHVKGDASLHCPSPPQVTATSTRQGSRILPRP